MSAQAVAVGRREKRAHRERGIARNRYIRGEIARLSAKRRAQDAERIEAWQSLPWWRRWTTPRPGASYNPLVKVNWIRREDAIVRRATRLFP